MNLNPFVFLTQMYSGQVEGYALLWIRVGFTHFGLIIPTKLWIRESVTKQPKWYRAIMSLLPLLRIDIWAHTGSLDQRWIFRFYLLGFSAGWLTDGETVKYGFDRPRGLTVRRGLFGF